ncbi:dockerin type I repeat-containing protein [Ruminococcus flavefaciens]|uniref:dockerin type I repeat-containing protein n=1 Tax=Ruminococcus flavefaciens TaxID=1265 RepID=UPI0026EDEAEA|nr:dockerin type I repeat-containing protein [Ruminococcus flavefaciens]MDD7517547.1 dockerin type I repeat-containing protein [Ruminococcus flavefaciens]MDY5691518.1 dockerin type I repeat-containing protein [Ruminococcus flavefaciens]
MLFKKLLSITLSAALSTTMLSAAPISKPQSSATLNYAVAAGNDSDEIVAHCCWSDCNKPLKQGEARIASNGAIFCDEHFDEGQADNIVLFEINDTVAAIDDTYIYFENGTDPIKYADLVYSFLNADNYSDEDIHLNIGDTVDLKVIAGKGKYYYVHSVVDAKVVTPAVTTNKTRTISSAFDCIENGKLYFINSEGYPFNISDMPYDDYAALNNFEKYCVISIELTTVETPEGKIEKITGAKKIGDVTSTTAQPIQTTTTTTTVVSSHNSGTGLYTTVPDTNHCIPTTTTTEEDEIWMPAGTGIDQVQEVYSLPTRIDYSQGEELSFDDFIVHVVHSYNVRSNKGRFERRTSERDVEIAYIDPEYYTITDENNKVYPSDSFKTLPSGTYYINIKENINYYSKNENPGIPQALYGFNNTSFDVEIHENHSVTTSSTNNTSQITTSTTSSYVPTYTVTMAPEYKLEKVNSYPTKTVYNEGEELDLSGLSYDYSMKTPWFGEPDGGGIFKNTYTGDESDVSLLSVTLEDKNKKTYKGTAFSTLDAGKYIVTLIPNKLTNAYPQEDNQIVYSIVINSLPVSSSTTTTAQTTTEEERWMYGTGVDHFKSIETLPTKTIYDKGEKLSLDGLVINAYHSVTRHSNKGNSDVLITDYVWNVGNIDPKYITIRSLGGKTYTTDEFTKLPGGQAYEVIIGNGQTINLDLAGSGDEKTVYNTDGFSFRIYINDTEKDQKFIKLDNATVENFNYGTASQGFKLKGMKAFSIDMDAHMHSGYDIESGIRMNDTVSGVLCINPKNNYIYFGDLEITKYAGLSGDANNDGNIDMGDVVIIMQSLANPDKYSFDGTDAHRLTKRGGYIGDVNGDGLTVQDANLIQRMLLGLDPMPTPTNN